ncbi:MAG: hypothetical protein H6774_02675 [Pseudomonadales bacterium]|nr:hypothetical protein [Pseudomonadales bacterium]
MSEKAEIEPTTKKVRIDVSGHHSIADVLIMEEVAAEMGLQFRFGTGRMEEDHLQDAEHGMVFTTVSWPSDEPDKYAKYQEEIKKD